MQLTFYAEHPRKHQTPLQPLHFEPIKLCFITKNILMATIKSDLAENAPTYDRKSELKEFDESKVGVQ
jgi:hypothetical protein